MQRVARHLSGGFTLLEMMVSLALGTLVIGAAVQVFTQSMKGSFAVSQQAEMQQDLRAAENMLVKDIGMAGSGGFNVGGLALVSGGGIASPLYGCSTSGCGPNSGSGVTFPATAGVNYLYAIVPGYRMGKALNASQGPTDTITVASVDSTLALRQYNMSFVGNQPNSATFTTPVPAPIPAPIPVTDPGVGLQVGDYLWISSTVAGSTTYAVAEVTGASGGASPYTVSFANPGSSKLNQVGGSYGLSSVVTGTGTTAQRLWVVTYYVDVRPDGTPVLMRQVNARVPVALTENISDLRFRYDIYDDTQTPPTQNNTNDANLSTGGSPNLIRKVDILHLTIRNPVAGTDGYQGMDVQTSISARNLGYGDRYPIQ